VWISCIFLSQTYFSLYQVIPNQLEAPMRRVSVYLVSQTVRVHSEALIYAFGLNTTTQDKLRRDKSVRDDICMIFARYLFQSPTATDSEEFHMS
jgi:hypothetical protein